MEHDSITTRQMLIDFGKHLVESYRGKLRRFDNGDEFARESITRTCQNVARSADNDDVDFEGIIKLLRQCGCPTLPRDVANAILDNPGESMLAIALGASLDD